MHIKFTESESTPLRPGSENCGSFKEQKLIHLCECCGRRDVLTPKEGYDAGWDYTPYMYPMRVLSPRICGDCDITDTAFWQVVVLHRLFEELSDKHKETVMRIYKEPQSILPNNED